MFKPLLIRSALVVALGAPTLQAEQAPVAPTQPPQPAQISAPVAETNASAAQLPEWVKERRAQLGVDPKAQAPAVPPIGDIPPPPPEMPAWVKEKQMQAAAPQAPAMPDMSKMPPPPPEIPAWVTEQRAKTAAPTPPQRPEMPPMAARPAAPEVPAWVMEQRAKTAAPTPPQRPEMPPMTARPAAPEVPAWVEELRARAPTPMRQPPMMARLPQQMAPPAAPLPIPAYQPWQGVPYGGWGRPYHGGNNGWRPWGGNNWSPWGNNWGGNAWNRGYGFQGDRPCHTPVAAMPIQQQRIEPEAPADGDEDGVNDLSDLCPNTAAGTEVDGLGCEAAARIVLHGVHFKTDSDELTIESLAILDGVSATLSANPQIRVMVAGHTDSDGDDAYNKDLSQRRAQSVVDYLASHGVDAQSMVAQGFGEEQPVASNDTAEGKAQNRRVELNRL